MVVSVPTLLSILKLAMAAKGKDLVGAADETWGLVQRFTAQSPRSFEGVLKAALEKAFGQQKIYLKQYADSGVEDLALLVDDYLTNLERSGIAFTIRNLARLGEPELVKELAPRLQEFLIIPGHQLSGADLASICRRLFEQVCAEVEQRIQEDQALCVNVLLSYCKDSDKKLEEVLRAVSSVINLNQQLIMLLQSLAMQFDQLLERVTGIDEKLQGAKYKNYDDFCDALCAELSAAQINDPLLKTDFDACVRELVAQIPESDFIKFINCVRMPFGNERRPYYDLLFDAAKGIIARLAIMKIVYPDLQLCLDGAQCEGQAVKVRGRRIAYIYPKNPQTIRLSVVQLLRHFYRKGIVGSNLIIVNNTNNPNCRDLNKLGANLGDPEKLVRDIGYVDREPVGQSMQSNELAVIKEHFAYRYHCCNHIMIDEEDKRDNLEFRISMIVED